ncbi:HNH endonuclease signature motif containing protein [Sphaerimonospora thailandensis]|uniref:HNH endonuclease signature motif containing protein n=1 Tax=Sphaerimonospora thailandensis TaxID=795644 RepID=UPI00194FCD73|nr:HNH endonuclease signature motif containing protein [Sphaerimonospora thailandensis]
MSQVRESALALALTPVPDSPRQCLAQVEELVFARDRLEAAIAARIARVHATGTAREHGHASTKTWLRSACGMSRRNANHIVALGTELERLPEVRRRFSAGSLTEGVVSAICAATARLSDEDAAKAETILLELADSAGPDEIAKAGRYLRAVLDPDGEIKDANADYDSRFLLIRETDTGGLEGEFRLPREAAARLRTLLDAYAKPKARGDDRPLRVRNADALIALLEQEITAELLVLVNAESLPDDPTPGATAREDDGSTIRTGEGDESADSARPSSAASDAPPPGDLKASGRLHDSDPADDTADDAADDTAAARTGGTGDGDTPAADTPAAGPPASGGTAPGTFGQDIKRDDGLAHDPVDSQAGAPDPGSPDIGDPGYGSDHFGLVRPGPGTRMGAGTGDEPEPAYADSDHPRGGIADDPRNGPPYDGGDVLPGLEDLHAEEPWRSQTDRERPGREESAHPEETHRDSSGNRAPERESCEAGLGEVMDWQLQAALRTLPGLLLSTGQLLPITDIHRLARTSALVRMVMNADGQVLDMGRKVRLATPAQRRAIAARYTTCMVDGCPLPAGMCQVDHIDNWSEGGRTDLAKLGPMCQYHNRDRYRHPDHYRRRQIGPDRWAFTYTGPFADTRRQT